MMRYHSVGKILPNSNAHTERLFSLTKAVHTPVRNSLLLETINASLAVKGNKAGPYTKLDSVIDQAVVRNCKKATMVYNELHK